MEKRITVTIEDIVRQISAAKNSNVAQLSAQYENLYGCAPYSQNKTFLLKRIAWKIQEKAFGGLSETANKKLAEIDEQIEVPLAVESASIRDERLPKIGSVIKRRYKSVEHEVTVLDGVFHYRGQTFESLSAVAQLITGTRWNGYRFFNLS